MSIWHWILVATVFLLLLGGRGKISELIGDFAEGISAFGDVGRGRKHHVVENSSFPILVATVLILLSLVMVAAFS